MEQVLSCFEALSKSDGSAMTEEVTHYLESAYHTPESILIFVELLRTNNNKSVKMNSIIGIQKWLTYNWDDSKNQLEIVSMLLETIQYFHDFQLLQTYSLIIGFIFYSPEFIGHLNKYIENALTGNNNNYKNYVASSLIIYNSIIETVESRVEMIRLLLKLIKIGMDLETDIKINAIDLAFHMCCLYESDLNINDIFNVSLELIFCLDKNQLKKLLKIFSENVDGECILIDVSRLIQAIQILIDKHSNDIDILDECFNVMYSIIGVSSDIFENEDLIMQINNFGLYLTKSKFNIDDYFDLSPFYYPQSIGEEFGKYPKILNRIIQQFDEFLKTDYGIFYISLFIESSFENLR